MKHTKLMKSFLWVSCSMAAMAVTAQGPALYPYRKGALWGYANADGKIVITPAYTAAAPFTEGLAAVALTENNQVRYGYIDAKNKLVIPMQYRMAEPFVQGRGIVTLPSGRKMLMDAKGKTIIDSISNIQYLPLSGYYRVTNARRLMALYDREGKALHNFMFTRIEDSDEGLFLINYRDSTGVKINYANKEGIILGPLVHQTVMQARAFSNGRAEVQFPGMPNAHQSSNMHYWTFIDRNGHPITQSRLSSTRAFKEDIGAVEQATGKVIFIDRMGKPLFDSRIFSCNTCTFQEGYVATEAGLLNKQGQIVLSAPDKGMFNSILGVRHGLISYRTIEGGKTSGWKLVATSNLQQVIYETDYARGTFMWQATGPVVVQKNGKYGLIDRTGKVILEPSVEGRVRFTPEGLISVSRENKDYTTTFLGYVSEKGKILWED